VVVVEESISTAVEALLQCHGIGGMRPNTLLLGWSEDPTKAEVFSESLSIAKKMHRSLVIVSCEEEREKGDVPNGAIHIWWSHPENGALMLLLAFILKENREWRGRKIRIIRPIAPKADVENVAKEMAETLAEARIEADLVVIPTDNPLKAVRDAMQPSAVLFAGFEPADEDPAGVLVSYLQETIDLPGDVILVYNAGDVSLEA